MRRNLVRIAFVLGVVLFIGLGSAVYDGRTHDAAGLAVFGLMAFGALPFIATWPDQ